MIVKSKSSAGLFLAILAYDEFIANLGDPTSLVALKQHFHDLLAMAEDNNKNHLSHIASLEQKIAGHARDMQSIAFERDQLARDMQSIAFKRDQLARDMQSIAFERDQLLRDLQTLEEDRDEQAKARVDAINLVKQLKSQLNDLQDDLSFTMLNFHLTQEELEILFVENGNKSESITRLNKLLEETRKELTSSALVQLHQVLEILEVYHHQIQLQAKIISASELLSKRAVSLALGTLS